MQFSTRFILTFLLIAAGWMTFVHISDDAKADDGLALSPVEYSNGSKRKAAVAEKVTPTLKSDVVKAGYQWGAPVFLRAFKDEKKLELWLKNKTGKYSLFRTYPIAAASGKLGPKLREGDGQVPEGFYFVTPDQMNPKSDFHLSFNIGYPNEYDRAHDRTGSYIMVHGSNVSIGCLAMTDEKIEEIFTLCDAAHQGGQKYFRIHIFPFRMSDSKMAEYQDHEWLSFWKNLQTGYTWFEEKKLPPDVSVKDKTYQFR